MPLYRIRDFLQPRMVRALLLAAVLSGGQALEGLAPAARPRGKRAPAAAVTLFQAALEERPHEPTALSELGWAAFLAGDFNLAESATLESLAYAGADTDTRGKSLYNLG